MPIFAFALGLAALCLAVDGVLAWLRKDPPSHHTLTSLAIGGTICGISLIGLVSTEDHAYYAFMLLFGIAYCLRALISRARLV